jgi:glycerol 3-phosphatase-2
MTDSQRALVDQYDAALFDLDGVIYLGPVAVPNAVASLRTVRDRGVRMGFVTNNAARPPQAVAKHLCELGIESYGSEVVTAAQAAAHLLVNRFGTGAKILIVGGEGIVEALREVGLVGVRSVDDEPVAVMQGYAPDLTWEQLNEAAIAIQRGAYWIATNTDSTRPTERGIVPGNGAAVRTAVDVDPEVAGKPYRPLMDEALSRLGTRRAILVGDRFDTDIAGAVVVGIDTLFVLTGAHGVEDLLAAERGCRPTHVGLDVGALLDPPREVSRVVNRVLCRAMSAVAIRGRIELETAPADALQTTDALWALANLAWEARDQGQPLDATPALRSLPGLP